MVIAQLLGGMGNQMFQYAVARHLSKLNNAEFKLDTSILLDWSPGKHPVNRSYDLDIFNVKGNIAKARDISKYNSQLMSFPQKIAFKVKRKIVGDSVTYEKFFHFDPEVLKLRGDLYFAGTWQSYKYFDAIGDIIRNDFSFKKPPSFNALSLIERMKSGVSVCLNVRRADYVSVKATSDILGFVGIDYYKSALSVMEAKVKNFKVYIFSDDLEWCKDNLRFITQPVEFIGHEYAGEKFSEYLLLMSSCHHFIIPNSTFAWWGAWLSSNVDKVVITPKRWLNDPEIVTNDLIPEEWIKL